MFRAPRIWVAATGKKTLRKKESGFWITDSKTRVILSWLLRSPKIPKRGTALIMSQKGPYRLESVLKKYRSPLARENSIGIIPEERNQVITEVRKLKKLPKTYNCDRAHPRCHSFIHSLVFPQYYPSLYPGLFVHHPIPLAVLTQTTILSEAHLYSEWCYPQVAPILPLTLPVLWNLKTPHTSQEQTIGLTRYWYSVILTHFKAFLRFLSSQLSSQSEFVRLLFRATIREKFLCLVLKETTIYPTAIFLNLLSMQPAAV